MSINTHTHTHIYIYIIIHIEIKSKVAYKRNMHIDLQTKSLHTKIYKHNFKQKSNIEFQTKIM